MFCTKCGKEIDEDAVFCPECGEKVSKTRKAEIQEFWEMKPSVRERQPKDSAPEPML